MAPHADSASLKISHHDGKWNSLCSPIDPPISFNPIDPNAQGQPKQIRVQSSMLGRK